MSIVYKYKVSSLLFFIGFDLFACLYDAAAGRGRASILNLMSASSASRPGGSVVPSSSMATVLSAYDSLLSIPSQSVYGQGQSQNALFAGLSTGSSLPSSLPAASR